MYSIIGYVEHEEQVMSRGVIDVSMLVDAIMMDEIVIGRIVLVCAWIFHVFYFLFRIKTRTVQ